MQTLEDKLERAELLLTRLHSRLYRTVNAIQKIDRHRKRLVDRIHEAPPGTRPARTVQKTGPRSFTVGTLLPEPAAPPAPPAPPPFDDSLDIPAAFVRPRLNPADEAAKAAILAEQADKAKKKRAASKAKAGDALAKKPLTGKAALEAIRG